MKSAILLLVVFAAAFSSCTTAYKTGQTPDDVYYSPTRPQEENDNVKKEEKKDYTYSDEYYSDRYLRMKVTNRYRWSDLNDWYNYDRYSYGYNYYYGSYNNPYNSWNYYYNPYCCCHTNNIYNGYNSPKVALGRPIIQPHNFSLTGYTNSSYNNTNSAASGNRVYNYSNTNNNTNNSNGISKTIRTIFESNNNNSSSSSSSSSRAYTAPSSSSSSSSSPSSSSSSSGGGSVSRPGRN